MSDQAPGKLKCCLCFINGNTPLHQWMSNVPNCTDATEIHLMHQSPPYLVSSLRASTPVYFPVSAPPVTWHSVQRMLVRITCVSDNADGIRGESIKHYPTPLSPSSPSCKASVQKCRSDSVPLFDGGH
jgi:hypothetical protein